MRNRQLLGVSSCILERYCQFLCLNINARGSTCKLQETFKDLWTCLVYVPSEPGLNTLVSTSRENCVLKYELSVYLFCSLSNAPEFMWSNPFSNQIQGNHSLESISESVHYFFKPLFDQYLCQQIQIFLDILNGNLSVCSILLKLNKSAFFLVNNDRKVNLQILEILCWSVSQVLVSFSLFFR